TNCTIAANGAFGISSNAPTVVNTIVYHNGPDTGAPQIDSDSAIVSYSDVQGGWPGEGNIDADPLFVWLGHWSGAVGGPAGSSDGFWVSGDYHLRSQAGRWDQFFIQDWVQDWTTSPCVDAGDPDSDYSPEPAPNGGRTNMGAYGGTPQASKSLAG
ncbi:MAG: hypothetical protein AMJ65_01220, partial [Phycisphaerae bacterium SG8_4]